MDPEKVNYHYCDDLKTTPLKEGTKILVTGASGYVARRLIPELVNRGYHVRCLYRNKHTPSWLSHPRIEPAYADCLNKEELYTVLKDIYVAYYFIHSMRANESKFAQMDKVAAKHFKEVAEESGVKKIIYLGGLGETNSRLSLHLRSRMEVGATLSESDRMTVIRLRAAIILGTGSASYELLKSLILHNRWIPFLKEFNSCCQPIAIRDVIKYLVGTLETPNISTGVYPIGCNDVFTYKELIQRFSRILKRPIHIFDISWVPLPVSLLCRIYAYWMHLFSPVQVNIISLLLNSLRTDVVCFNKDIEKFLPFEPLGFDEAIERALDKENRSMVYSHWSDVPPAKMRDFLPLCEYEASGFVIEKHSIEIPSGPEQIFPLLAKLGGKQGWFHGNILWRIRGFIDLLLGGVGLQRGRRDDLDLRVGDSIDFWRVEKLETNRELLLRAEMLSPGLSWLQFELVPMEENKTLLTLTAHFIPVPFWGHIYWFALSKFHTYIFRGMLNHFYRVALGEREPGWTS